MDYSEMLQMNLMNTMYASSIQTGRMTDMSVIFLHITYNEPYSTPYYIFCIIQG